MVVVNHVMDIIVNHDENYSCNLCGNNSHDGYDCQQQFSFVYEQEPSYNQNYDDNYYPHESLSFACCDYCGGSHETFQCQPDNQNDDFSGSDQIQTPQYPDVNPPSPEIKYDQSTSTDRPIFLKSDEGHSVQDKESLENPFNEISVSKPDNESDLELEVTTDTELSSTKDIHPLKQKMENMMLELVKICQEKEFLCIHDDVDDLIKSALDSKLLLINSNSQRPDKKEREVKNVVEQPAEHGNRSIQSLQNFRVVHKIITPPFHHHHHHLRSSTSSNKLFGSSNRIGYRLKALGTTRGSGGNEEEEEEEDEVDKALRLDGSIPGSSNEFVEQVSSRAYDMRRHLQQSFDSSSYDGTPLVELKFINVKSHKNTLN
nr:hypothetical protein [Tanacetum cinerariifolium]